MADAEPISWKHLKARTPGDADRAALRETLLERAALVAAQGWNAYRDTWTPSDLAAVAYLLEDTDMLAELDEHEGAVLTRFAGELYGFQGARKEIESGLRGTQEWFAAARAELARRGR
ncbi:hypothetical protein [Nocardia sp. NPDC048505]|uniref:hypothetical protein n=1 Tax=unclassified Nocardia TaxID=2637762 RepID=UPI0033CD152F